MIYTHLTPNELVMIETYFNLHQPVTLVSKALNRSRQIIYNIYNFLKRGKSIRDYYQQYKENKIHCGRRPIISLNTFRLIVVKTYPIGKTGVMSMISLSTFQILELCHNAN